MYKLTVSVLVIKNQYRSITNFDQVNVRITVVIFPDEHLLKQLSFTWFSINHVLVSNLIIRIFWGALLSLNDLHLTSSEERLFLQHCIICLGHLHLIALRHVIRDIEWYLDQYLLHCYRDLIGLDYHAYFAQFESLNKTELFFAQFFLLYLYTAHFIVAFYCGQPNTVS